MRYNLRKLIGKPVVINAFFNKEKVESVNNLYLYKGPVSVIYPSNTLEFTTLDHIWLPVPNTNFYAGTVDYYTRQDGTRDIGVRDFLPSEIVRGLSFTIETLLFMSEKKAKNFEEAARIVIACQSITEYYADKLDIPLYKKGFQLSEAHYTLKRSLDRLKCKNMSLISIINKKPKRKKVKKKGFARM